VPAAIRRAVIARDKTGRFTGCGRPGSWCEVHHVKHRADGGETSVSNGVLMCGSHHRLLHEEGFGVERIDGHPVFRRPDGSVVEDNRAPP
jgi:5-methylcytosine-specific restriction endonuclease McrA